MRVKVLNRFLTLVFVLVMAPLVHASNMEKLNPLIVNGQDADLFDLGFVALVFGLDLQTGTSISCTGSFVDRQYIITAAHCIEIDGAITLTADDLEIRYGNQDLASDSGQVWLKGFLGEIADVTVHPSYNALTLDNDIAVIKLTEPVGLSSIVSPAVLPTLDNVGQVSSGELLRIAGWGLKDINDEFFPTNMQEGTVNLLGGEVCQDVYGVSQFDPALSLCADDVNSPASGSICTGDSGGPLFKVGTLGEYYLLGVASAGPDPCGTVDAPDIFTSVCVYMAFLDSAMGDAFEYTNQECPVYPNPQTVIGLGSGGGGSGSGSQIGFESNLEPTGKTANGSFSIFMILGLLFAIVLLRQRKII